MITPPAKTLRASVRSNNLSNKDRLCALNGFLIDLDLTKAKLPSILIHENKYFYRYMDRIFSPIPILELNSSQSKDLCDIRLQFFDLIVKHLLNDKLLQSLICQVREIKDCKNILDFGCGNGKYTGKLKDLLIESELFGVDISELAIEFSKKQRSDIFWLPISEGKAMPFEDRYFSCIVSTFVMHFNVSPCFLKELSRVLKIDGKFIFNIYNSKYLPEDLFNKLKAANFEVFPLITYGLPNEHRLFEAKILNDNH